MKRLLLLRHAKSDWSAEYEEDHDRPLAPRGLAAAPVMGRFLAGQKCRPDAIFSSSAVRARRTAELLVQAASLSCTLEITEALYGASAQSVLEFLHARDDVLGTVMLVGHEPGWSELASALVGGGELRMPTAALACLDLDVESWTEAEFGCGTLMWLVTPKVLARGQSHS